MADTEHTVNINHNLDEYNKKIEESNKLWDEHLAKIRSVNNQLNQIYGRRGGRGGGAGGGGGGGGGGPGGGPPNMPGGISPSTYNNLNVQYMRQALNYFKAFPAQTKVLAQFSSTMQGMMGGIAKIARGSVAAGAADMALEAAKFTVERGTAFRDRAAGALAVNLTPYQQQAFANNLKMYTGGEAGTQALFGGLVQQQTQIGGPAYLKNFLNRFGVKLTGKETQEQLAEDVLRAERQMATTVDPQLWQKYAEIFKVGNVVDQSALMRFRSGNVSADKLEDDIKRAEKAGEGGTEGKNLIELTQQIANSILNMEKGIDALADKIAGAFLKFQHSTPAKPNDPTGIYAPTPEQKKKGYGWDLHLNLDDWWNSIKKLFGKAGSGVGELFGVGSAQAGELTGSQLSNKAASVPDNIQDIKDILARAFPLSGTDVGSGSASGMGGIIGAGGRVSGPGRHPTGGSYGVDEPPGGAKIYPLAENKKLTPEMRALGDTFAVFESAGKYDIKGGLAKAMIGRYQFNPLYGPGSTWWRVAEHFGWDPKKFPSHEQQDQAFEWWASKRYKEQTGEDLQTALEHRDFAKIKRALTPGEWEGPAKYSVQGMGKAFEDFLKREKDSTPKEDAKTVVNKANGAPDDKTKTAVKKAVGAPPANIHIPNVYHGGQSSEYPAPGEKSSLNNMNLYQQEKGSHIRISNIAGASVTVQSTMLGAVKGSYA